MPLSLGAAFAPRPIVVEEFEAPQTTVEDLRNEQLLTALAALHEALQNMPAPVVNVSEPDLTAIVQAVTSLKGPATADEIARAVVNEISPGGELGMDKVLEDLTAALKKLDFRLQGMGQGGGTGSAMGPATIDVGDRGDRVLGKLNYSEADRLMVDIGGAVNVSNLTVQYESKVSILNSTQTPLAANAMFTGEWEDARDYATISVAVFTDVMSAINGAVVEFTEDVTKGAIRSIPTTVLGGSGAHFSLAPQARYFRLRYTNGATAQTVMRSETTLKFNPPAPVQQPLAAPTTDANLATIVKSHLTGRQSTGAWTPVLVNSSGHASVRVESDPAEPVIVHDPITYFASTAGGQVAFNITTDIVTVSGGGAQPLAYLLNPVDSPYDIYLDLGEFGSSNNTTFRRVRNATVALAVGAMGTTPGNMGGGSQTSPVRFYRAGNFAEFTTTGGAVVKTAHIAQFQQYLTQLKGRVILRPGNSLMWTITNSSAIGATLTASIFFEFWQLPKAV